MPYNKGDFTQQGVAGHVNANLRLNEKRLVNIDLTSNEEAEGCTITGTVTDLLNDKVYNIGSGGGGGGGDEMLKTTMTLNNKTANTIRLSAVLTWAGYYGIKADVLDAANTPYLIWDDTNDGNVGDLLSSLTIAPNESFSVDLYYIMDSAGDTPMFGVTVGNELANAVLVNMSYLSDYNTYAVTDNSLSSSMVADITD